MTSNADSQPVLAAHQDRNPKVLKPFLSCGLDLTDVARFEQEVARRGNGLIEELFSAAELGWCRRRRRAAEGYAMAYAAKEALFKALGRGKVGRMAWRDVEVAWLSGTAQPAMALSGETAAVAAAMGMARLHLSLACTRALAAAVVVIEGAGDQALGASETELSPREWQLNS